MTEKQITCYFDVSYGSRAGQTSGRIWLNPKKSPVSLGRTDRSDLVFPDMTVAKRHALVWFENGQWYIEDQQSHCGLYLGVDRLVGVRALQSGDVIHMGQVCLVFGQVIE